MINDRFVPWIEKTKFSIFLLGDNKPIYSGPLFLNEDYETNFFSIKVFDINQFVITENFQKKIVALNEIFQVHFTHYVIVSNAHPVHVMTRHPNSNIHFCGLCENDLFKFVSSLLRDIFSFKFNNQRKNSFYFLAIFLLFFVVFGVYFERGFASDIVIESNKVKIQKKIYLRYKKILENSIPQKIENDLIFVKMMRPKKKLSQNKKRQDSLKFKKIIKIQGEDDSEVQYFLFGK